MFQYELQEDIIIASMYIIPFAIICTKRMTFKQFNYKKLVTALNYSLIHAIIIFISILIASNVIEHFWINSIVMDILYYVTIGYFGITTIFYFPIVLILNIPLLISWAIRKQKAK